MSHISDPVHKMLDHLVMAAAASQHLIKLSRRSGVQLTPDQLDHLLTIQTLISHQLLNSLCKLSFFFNGIQLRGFVEEVVNDLIERAASLQHLLKLLAARLAQLSPHHVKHLR